MGQKKFDLVFSNPPYNNNMDLKIISVVLLLCKEMVVVHPSTWLLDLKGLAKRYNDFKANVCGKLRSVEFFNGNPIFNIGLFVPCIITHIDRNYNDNVTVDYFGEKYNTDSLYNVTKFGTKWETIVKPFMLTIGDYVLKNGSIWGQRIKNLNEVDQNKFHCQLAAIIGNHGKGSSKMSNDDFYTTVMKNSERNKGIRKEGMITFEFNTEVERNNFIGYCKTDFARFCLSLYKNNQHSESGEMTLIPWMDFTQEWTDKTLYKLFEINKETQKYIEDFLPDYYSIREGIKEKTYFGSIAVENSTGGEKSTNIYIDKDKAKELTKHIDKMVEETDKDETLCLFLSKERKRLTVTKKMDRKK